MAIVMDVMTSIGRAIAKLSPNSQGLMIRICFLRMAPTQCLPARDSILVQVRTSMVVICLRRTTLVYRT